jgi:NADH-quinone oxidoreductase subunit D
LKTNFMAQVQDIEIPDSASRAAKAVDDLADIEGDRMVLNMGPSHPATHGVLRIVLELDGEEITKADPDVGYLHRGDEKIAENMTYTQFIPYTDRLDYLAPLANNVAYALSVEKALGIHDKLPPRCQYIRVMCCELARISSHLLGLGAFAMDRRAIHHQLYADWRSPAGYPADLVRSGPCLHQRMLPRDCRSGSTAHPQPDLGGSSARHGSYLEGDGY